MVCGVVECDDGKRRGERATEAGSAEVQRTAALSVREDGGAWEW